MNQLKKYFLFFLFLILIVCSSVLRNTVNACAIFDEKYLWYKFAKSTEKKWGAPVELQMAIIKKESGYDWLARPERTKLFKVIPWKRKSSSLGYVDQTYKKMKVSKKNYFRQYLYYYNGWTKRTRPESIPYAKEVSRTAKKYRAQIRKCQSKLNRNKYIIF